MINAPKRNVTVTGGKKKRPCGWCGRLVSGRRHYCNDAHKQAAYRSRLERGTCDGVHPANKQTISIFFSRLFDY